MPTSGSECSPPSLPTGRWSGSGRLSRAISRLSHARIGGYSASDDPIGLSSGESRVKGGDNVDHYLLIESRDPFETNDVLYYYELTKGLVEAGNEVTLLLVQNGVLAARPSAHSATLSALGRSGVKVLADDFSLRERGISKLAEGVLAAPIDVVIDHLEAGHKTLWH